MKLGLSLSGGGIKGAAHIGVLKAFEEENIKIDYISGTSCGSIIASLYAMGYKPDEIYYIFKNYSNKINYVSPCNILKLILGLIFRRKIIINGLNNGKIIEKLIKKYANEKNIYNINEIKMPLIIPSVNLNDGSIYIFTSLKNVNLKRNTYSDEIIYIDDFEIEKVVKASCAYPGIFEPFKYDNIQLIDGGIRENIPWKESKKAGADFVISVVFEKKITRNYNKNIMEIIDSSIEILSHELANYELIGNDYVIKVFTNDISLLDNTKVDYLYEKGYQTAKKEIKNIKEKMKSVN